MLSMTILSSYAENRNPESTYNEQDPRVKGRDKWEDRSGRGLTSREQVLIITDQVYVVYLRKFTLEI